LFAYGPADATAIPKPHHLLRHLHPDWFHLSGASFTQTPNPLPKSSITSRPGQGTTPRSGAVPSHSTQGRRQLKICGVDRHSECGARAYNWGLGAERPPIPPCKNSSDLYQFQQRSLAVHPAVTPLPNCHPPLSTIFLPNRPSLVNSRLDRSSLRVVEKHAVVGC